MIGIGRAGADTIFGREGQMYSVHRVGSGTLGSLVCRISDLGVTVHLANNSGVSGCPSKRGREGRLPEPHSSSVCVLGCVLL